MLFTHDSIMFTHVNTYAQKPDYKRESKLNIAPIGLRFMSVPKPQVSIIY